MLGTLGMTEDGRFALRFERRLAHPPEKVWRALTETDRLRAWFVQILDYDRLVIDPRPGARLEFPPAPEHAGLGTGHGEVLRADPPYLLEYTWDAETLRWELTPDGPGCLLVFTDIFPDRGSASALGAGWHAGLDLLQAALDGTPPAPPAWERLHADYERALR